MTGLRAHSPTPSLASGPVFPYTRLTRADTLGGSADGGVCHRRFAAAPITAIPAEVDTGSAFGNCVNKQRV